MFLVFGGITTRSSISSAGSQEHRNRGRIQCFARLVHSQKPHHGSFSWCGNSRHPQSYALVLTVIPTIGILVCPPTPFGIHVLDRSAQNTRKATTSQDSNQKPTMTVCIRVGGSAMDHAMMPPSFGMRATCGKSTWPLQEQGA